MSSLLLNAVKAALDQPANNRKSYTISIDDLDDMIELAANCPAMQNALEQVKIIYALAGSPRFRDPEDYDDYEEDDYEEDDCDKDC